MRIIKEFIKEFKELYFKKEGKKLSDKEAFELAHNLLSAFENVYRPIPSQKLKIKKSNEYNINHGPSKSRKEKRESNS